MINTILVVFGLLIFSACSQLASEGTWTPRPVSEETNSKHVIPPQDNEALLAAEDDSHGGYQFANVIDFSISFDSWDVTVLPNGDMVWRTTIVSYNAYSLGVTFEGLRIPEGGELYTIGANKTRGAFTHINNPTTGKRQFTSFPIEGNFLILEYYQPASVKALPVLEIVKVAHGYKALGPLCFDCSGACNINVACEPAGWNDQIRSVGILLTASGSRFCSGSLINNADSDGDQLFLTAQHCSAGESDSVMFRYQSDICEPTRNGPLDYIVGGFVRLAFNSLSDFLVLRITEPIPASWELYLNGISGENVPGQALKGIHHPRGDVKKISHSNGPATPARWTGAEPGDGYHWRVPFWDEGTTEPGSSGSPLFDQNKRVVGQLHGGPASCATISYDLYGGTWASWDLGLGDFVDPSGTGNKIIDGIDLNTARANAAKKRAL